MKDFTASYKSSSLTKKHDVPLQHGRGGVHQFTYNNMDLVLRHYHRGGLPAKIINDQYIWTGFEKSRAMQELRILADLQEFGLPVPEPAAARVCKKGLIYQADIVTILIPKVTTLSSILTREEISDQCWQQLGEVIKQFHQHNCNHADLNAHNIMLNKYQEDCQGIHLIDFDKSKFDESSDGWKMKNLQRLKRSLEKLKNENNGFGFNENNFSSLMQGYAE